ncbi:NTP transferase domain-containing protein [Pararobbsia silviterrae]|uniref:Phosphocholine cytidylyltransferase family protein n=1 Tax=Pararobbsia silviterrae TaxID=1792498 RepID=A0A494X773_9BURK|nr:phosphocholine cytidylyltransferase family protein [Pararobbsia silviterrae]RKP46557.1 phosphocholine cytidylyltransferase family protein [Pararobbsia silviterrae]
MRAIILAAGRGSRLLQTDDRISPKCLLRFDGVTLLERHLRLLRTLGVEEVVLALGFEHQQIEAELDRIQGFARPSIVINPQYTLGSVLTVHTVADALVAGGDVLLMDADVLYDERVLAPLVVDASANRLLIDRAFEEGDEPVKLCVRDGVPVELRKQVAANLAFDTIGESVGFFRFTESAARRLADIVADYVEGGRANLPHEEAVRDLLLEQLDDPRHPFDVADVTGAPWIEIDFPNDVVRAADEVLPQLEPLPLVTP